MMKGRLGANGGGGGVPADLVVCFPSRARLKLMPKPICSPSRPAELVAKRQPSRPAAGRTQASPLFKTKTEDMSSEIDDEPTSPKVTCAGQIKVSRPKCRSRTATTGGGSGGGSSSRNWLTVVEEIERLHKQRRRPHWLDAVGLKKDVMQFLGAFRGLRFPMGCFGSFPGPVGCASDDEEDGEDDEDGEVLKEEEADKEIENNGSKTIFSKWFMVLEENQGLELNKETGRGDQEQEGNECFEESSATTSSHSAPPPNALLLMRCRSAPAKGWLKRREGEEEEDEEDQNCSEEDEVNAKMVINEEKEKERLVLMSYAPDFFKISTDIAKETWIVGCMDPMARSRSWKR